MNVLSSLFLLLLLCCISSLSTTLAAKTEPTGECLPVGADDEFHCVSNKDMIACQDEHTGCQEWAQRGECKKNAAFMFYNCRKSCETCVR